MESAENQEHQELERKLRRFVAPRVPAAEVDDVLQDVFVRVQRSLSGLRDQDRFMPWLWQVAHSAVQESLRQRARHPLPRAGDGPQPEPEPESFEPLNSGLAAFAASAIARLPSPYREALTMTELEGVPQREAARRFGLSPSGMKSRVQRGREKLRHLLEGSCKIVLDARGGVVDCEPKEQGGCSCPAPQR